MSDNTVTNLSEHPRATQADHLYAAWKHAKGKWDMESYEPQYVEDGLPDEIGDALCDETCSALNAYLLHPSNDVKEVARKMRVIQDEQIFESWYKSAEIASQLCVDTHRIAFGAE